MTSRGQPLSAWPWPRHQRAAKRALDVAVSSVALILAAPLLLLLGAAVKLTSPGPVLFLQERVGRGGRRFRIWKFRTMIDEAPDQGPAITASGDPRVTGLGRLLRRTKLDELPQLVNVWRGDMSLVGPRPEVPKYVAGYSEEDRLVLSIRPGITDQASITFRDEEALLAQFADRERAYVEVLLPRKLALAREYVRQQSFKVDLELLARTLLVVVQPGATGAAPTSRRDPPPAQLPSAQTPPVSSRRA